MAYRNAGREFVGLEIQPELAALAQKNVEVNGFAGRIRIVEMDFRKVSNSFPAETFDLVVSNPPYRRLHTGRVNPHQQRALARHELTASIKDAFAAGKYLLPQRGRMAVTYPATRLDHLLVVANHYGFSPKVLTIIHSNPSSPARLVHLDCRKGGGEELHVASPLFIYQQNGCYTESMQRMYELGEERKAKGEGRKAKGTGQ
jgi:tRNA1Val (adenine37-N6)-methyltransferase